LVSACHIPAGTRITREMIAVKKPGTGIPPRRLQDIVGRVALWDIPANTILREEDFGA